VLVDVRERDEYAAENIEGAINLPLSSFNPAQIPKLEPGKHLVIHCRSGVRCGTASGHLAASGWEGEIIRMRGGILGWKAADCPTRRGS
jgi:rhodanese-related sulfurtransferase